MKKFCLIDIKAPPPVLKPEVPKAIEVPRKDSELI